MDGTQEAPTVATLRAHEHRGTVLEEVHARPFRPLGTPRRLLHFAFLTDAAEAEADRAALVRFCAERGVEQPRDGVRQFRTVFGDKALRWEQHGEFTTYCWQLADGDGSLFIRQAGELAWPMGLIEQPGRHLVSVDLQLVRPEATPDLAAIFDAASLCSVTVEDGAARVSTDFKAGADGFVRILVVNQGLDPTRTGALAQRLLELETYRLLALLGLPEAQRLSEPIARIERSLVEITREMTRVDGLDANQRLLDRIAALAAELEAGVAESLFRFGATRAYHGIVQGRLAAIHGEAAAGGETFDSFLSRRMTPALRTCAAIEARQASLSSRLARAAQLLRTKVDIELERQNRDILSTLSERTRLQLRLQHTVEGLSIAAVSYYVVGLIGHLAGLLPALGLTIDKEVVTAAAIPVVVAAVAWFILMRVRRHKNIP
ncbi:DUF3422 domain-containing protein [Labrys wisconsinensis]|uniref:Membrane-anchored protein n=1 Tax=Labrys wisconsinensis TaxID=425677 RepID=A0ABU0J3E9_9HYPH|nr:DUF3422 domain-containing protein [Labrys wisconsinensis]MDQ0468791.1 putative membrane-anchored protein [Labrys wisconsinensis]